MMLENLLMNIAILYCLWIFVNKLKQPINVKMVLKTTKPIDTSDHV
jgi:hypothetical protein